jgi:predicted nucleotidyltransferase
MEPIMRRDQILAILAEHRDELVTRFGVRSLRLFGSTARDEANAESDVDVLVDFYAPPSLFGFLRLRTYLEDLFGASVDLVTEAGLKDRARPFVEQDAIRVT